MNYCQFRNDVIKRMANAGGGLLPKEYQQVEYLESSYTQYIDTLYTPTTNDLRIVTRLNVLREGNSDDRFFGSQRLSTCALVPWFYGSTGTKPLGLIAAGTSYYLGQVNTNYNTIYDIDVTANNGRLTGDYCGYTLNTTYSDTVGNKLSIYIFAANLNQTINKYKCYARFYKFEIYSGGEQRFNGIPCCRKSDNKPGMYDLVTNTFFTNAGTGEFTVGQDV